MSSHGASDASSNAPMWAAAQFAVTPNSANRDALFGNVTASAFKSGATDGLFAVSAAEQANSGTILSVTVLSPGSGATARPTITITDPDGGGTGATATANMQVVSASANGQGTNGNYVQTTGATSQLSVAAAANAYVALINVETTMVRGTPAINAAGGAYTNGDVVTTTTGAGVKATFTLTTNATGNVTSLAVTTRGGYTTNPTNLTANVATTGVTLANAVANGLTIFLAGNSTVGMGVNSVSVANGGSFTTSFPTLAAAVTSNNAAQTGSGATLVVSMGLQAIVVTAGGHDYSSTTAFGFNQSLTGQVVVANFSPGHDVAHSGWVLRRVGSGGRAGRVQTEVLVAGGINTDASDDSILPP